MSGVGKSTLASSLLTSLNRDQDTYKYLSIDNYRLLYSDGSLVGEQKAYDIFLNDCQMYTHSVIECTGLSVHFNTLLAQATWRSKKYSKTDPVEMASTILHANPYEASNLKNLVFYCFCNDIERRDRVRSRDKQSIPFPKEYTNIEEYSSSKFVPSVNVELDMEESVKENVLWINKYIDVYTQLYNLEDKHYAKR
jgi:hypothetical protein